MELFRKIVRKRLVDALENDGFVKEDFKIQESTIRLVFTYESYLDFTFTIENKKQKELTNNDLMETTYKAFKIVMKPGEYNRIEDGYFSINQIEVMIREWIGRIKEELEVARENNWNDNEESEEKKEEFIQKVDNYFKQNVENTNEFLSKNESNTVKDTVDHWKDQVETILAQNHTEISALETQVKHMQKQLNSLKKDAEFKTKTDYVKNVFKKIGIFVVAYPTVREQIFEVMEALLAPLGYQDFLQSDWAQTLESTGELPSAENDEEEN